MDPDVGYPEQTTGSGVGPPLGDGVVDQFEQPRLHFAIDPGRNGLVQAQRNFPRTSTISTANSLRASDSRAFSTSS